MSFAVVGEGKPVADMFSVILGHLETGMSTPWHLVAPFLSHELPCCREYPSSGSECPIPAPAPPSLGRLVEFSPLPDPPLRRIRSPFSTELG